MNWWQSFLINVKRMVKMWMRDECELNRRLHKAYMEHINNDNR